MTKARITASGQTVPLKDFKDAKKDTVDTTPPPTSR